MEHFRCAGACPNPWKGLLAGVALLLLAPLPAWGQARTVNGPPPAPVVVAEVRTGTVQPQGVYVGTVYYDEVTEVAAETAGRVQAVAFGEGERVAAGQVLVELDTALLAKSRNATRASQKEARAGLELERLNLKRIGALFQRNTVSEQEYDRARFTVLELESRLDALDAAGERLDLEIAKGRIKAPFEGRILNKTVDRGEWLGPGSTVATLGADGVLDIRVNVPEEIFIGLRTGQEVVIQASAGAFTGRIAALIPSGDIATRTFPVKIRAANTLDLPQGMEAQVRLPRGEAAVALLVPRDALLLKGGQNMVFKVAGGRAQAVPVDVRAYLKDEVAVAGDGLAQGDQVVIKGNERLQPGQPVTVAP